MAYASWSVVFGEQPSAAKWNILGTNDASFNDGTGFGNNIVQGKHIDTNLNAGWIDPNETWTYASATTITVPSNATNKYAIGDRIKLVQSATTKYFVVTAVAATVLTINGGTDYTLANSAISGQYYSHAQSPAGFPIWFNFSPTWTNLTVGNGTQVARFSVTGKICFFRIHITWGSSSSISGTVEITPSPSAKSDYVDRTPLGLAHYEDNGTAAYIGRMYIYASKIRPLVYSVSGANVILGALGATTPMTWATNDTLLLQGQYEIA